MINWVCYQYWCLRKTVAQIRSNYVCKHKSEKEKMKAVNYTFDMMDKKEAIKK